MNPSTVVATQASPNLTGASTPALRSQGESQGKSQGEAQGAAGDSGAARVQSAQWPRVANLRPSLLTQVSARRQLVRGERWYVLSNDAAGVHHRVNDSAYQFIGRLDGRATVHEAWTAARKARGDAAPTQDEAIQLMVQLDQRELLQVEHTDEAAPLFFSASKQGRPRRKRFSLNPFAFRLALGDPAQWLARLDALGRVLFSRASFLVCFAVAVMAALVAGAHGGQLVAHGRDLLPSSRMIVLSWVLFPLIKALHEIGHGMAVRRYGGSVPEFGIGLFMLVPAPYVDASASTRFASRTERVVVGAAGIWVELMLATFALVIWLLVQPGLVRDIAFVVMFIGTVSTLFINGNPLLRYDGYYVAIDALELPNLATRSSQYWAWIFRRTMMRLPVTPPQAAPGELKWLLTYAPVSTVYRFVLWVALVLWLGSHWIVLGAVALCYMLYAVFLRPLVAWIRQSLLMTREPLAAARVRKAILVSAVVAALLVFVLPLPLTTVAPAVVWLPEQAQVRAGVDGFVREIKVRDGQKVAVGDVLAVLDNPDLQTEVDKLSSRLQGLQSDRFQLLLRDPAAAQNLAEDIARTEAELKRAEERLALLEIRAEEAGVLSLPRHADLPGQFVKRGAAIGYVLADNNASNAGAAKPVQLRAAVDQDHEHLVRNRTRRVEARLAEEARTGLGGVGVVMPAALSANVPAATRQLPSMALGDRAGGPYTVDPADAEGLRAVEPVVLVDVHVDRSHLASSLSQASHAGGRAWVRFEHGFEPLAFQLYRRAMQLFLKQFDPAV